MTSLPSKGRRRLVPEGASTDSSSAFVAGGAALVAVAGALIMLQVVAQRPGIMPAFLIAAAICPLVFLRPAWIVPVFIGLVWTAIGRDQFGGLSPINLGSYALLPAAAWFAWRRPDVAAAPAMVFALIALPLVATGMLGAGGSSISASAFKDLAFLFIAALCVRYKDVEKTIVVLAFVGIFLSIGAVYSVKAHPTALFTIDQGTVTQAQQLGEAPRAAGPFGESNFFALSLAALVPFCLYLVGRGRWRAWLGIAALLSLVAGIYSTGSRGAGLAAVVGIAVFAFKSRDSRVRAGAVAAILAGVVLLFVFNAQTSGSASRTVSGRATENQIALSMFADHPIAGVGPGQYPTFYRDYARRIGNDPRSNREPHSLPLQIAAEQGLIGIIGWIAAGIYLFGYLRSRRVWHDRVGSVVIVSIITYLVGSIFLHGSQLRLLFVLVGLAVAVGERYRLPPQARAPA